MTYIPIQKILSSEDRRLFTTVLLAAQRANELVNGAQPLVETDSKKVSTIALSEISDNKVYYSDESK